MAFRRQISGKYAYLPNISSSESFVGSSQLSPKAPLTTSSDVTPGRTLTTSTLEAPDIPITVEPFQPATYSRPGPVYGDHEGVFQPVSPGKYPTYCSNSPPEVDSRFSHPERSSAGADSTATIAPDPASEPHYNSPPEVDSRSSPPEWSNAQTNSTAADVAGCSTELHLYYQNTNGLRTKIDEVFLSTSELDYDVYVFTETNLDDCIQSCQLFNNDFCVYRVDRCASNSERQSGGGVLIAVKRKYAASVVQLSTTNNIEHLWVRISIEPLPLFVGVLYLPPDKSRNVESMMLHIDAISEISRRFTDVGKLVLLGDFNQPGLVWRSSGHGYAFADPVPSQLTMASQTLLDYMAFLGLRQRNLIRNNLDRVLDLVFSSDSVVTSGIVSLATEEVVPIEPYHPPLCFTVICESPVLFGEDVDLTERDYRRGNYDALNELLSEVDWSEVYQSPDVDGAVSCFNRIIQNCIDQTVPLKRPPKNPAWSNRHLCILRRRRSKLLQLYCRQRCLYVKRQFNEASRIYRGYNRFLYKSYVRRKEDDLRRNPKRFWSFVNSKRKQNGLPTSMHLGDIQALTTETKCDLFSQKFSDVFVSRVPTDEEIDIAVRLIPRDVVDLDVFNINAAMVESSLQKLKPSYQPGPDGIPSCIFKKCGTFLAAPLRFIFNQSLQHQRFPSAWKISHMLPVHKKGNKSDISNYRGITSLSAGSKCFEIIIKDVLFSSCRNYISSSQHGFFPKRSVDTNLCEFTSFCIGAMDDGVQVDAVYTDIKAAFDTVSHDILLAKLHRLGISDGICNWLRSYLSNRQLYVKIGSTVSDGFTPCSGVPQGSNLGPLLFVLFFNDVTILLANGGILIYADDLKIYLIVQNEDDCRELQKLLDLFVSWCRSNFLEVSVSKCCVISYRRLKRPILFNYNIDDQVLERVDKVKDLGMLLDYQLTFKLHYSAMIDKANRQLGFVLKMANDFSDPICLRALYCSLVRSILEFASVVWSPYEALWKSRIESVQHKFVRRALRRLPWRNPDELPRYEHRCALLGIEPLETRRDINQAVFGAKLLCGEIDSPALLERMRMYAPERVLRPRQVILPEPRNTVYGDNEPMNSISRRFQEGYHVFDFNVSCNSFRQRLRTVFLILN